MIRKLQDCSKEVRHEMRGGEGDVKIRHFWKSDELGSPTRLCAELTLDPGVSIGFHRHEKEEEIFIVVSGEGEVDDNGKKAAVKAGDTILTGNGAGHGIRNTGKTPLVIVAVIGSFPEQA